MAIGNDFLDHLSADDLRGLSPRLRRRRMARNDVLVRDGDPVTTVFLPTTSIISVA